MTTYAQEFYLRKQAQPIFGQGSTQSNTLARPLQETPSSVFPDAMGDALASPLSTEQSLESTPVMPDGTEQPTTIAKVAGMLPVNDLRAIDAILKTATRAPEHDVKTSGCLGAYMIQKKHKKKPKKKRLKEAGLQELIKRSMMDPMLGEEQRKQDVHEQQLQFAQDKHDLELVQMQMGIEQQQAQHAMQQQHTQEEAQQKADVEVAKQQETAQVQQAQAQSALQQKVNQQQQQGIQQADQHRQNMMKASAVKYDAMGQPIVPSSPIPSTLLGAGMGGAAAHYMFPTEATAKLREMAAKITPEAVQESAAAAAKGNATMNPVKITDQVGKRFNFKAPDHVAKKFYQNKAMQSNAKRLLKGLGIGAVAGYGINELMDQS